MKNTNKNRLYMSLFTLLLLVLVAIPSVSIAAQAPVNLGTTESFAVLAGTTITNTGPTVINGSTGGDVGLYPGTAFPGQSSVTIAGAVHLTDEVARKAKEDLVTAYDDAAGRTPVTRIATELGGQTLTPGVYDSASGTFGITGTLTLDAQGDPDGVFIFLTDSTLITASDSVINPINSARFCRIFWQVGSSATLGTNSHFVGHILALSSITAGNGATVQGQLLARNGAVTLNNNTITNGLCAAAQPVTDTGGGTDTDTGGGTDTDTGGGTDTDTGGQRNTDLGRQSNTDLSGQSNTELDRQTNIESGVQQGTVSGGELPKTATPWYNILLAGMGMVFAGTVTLGIRWRNEYIKKNLG